MSQKGSVTNIDINFLSSWFPIDGEGIYARADKSKLVFNRSNILKVLAASARESEASRHR